VAQFVQTKSIDINNDPRIGLCKPLDAALSIATPKSAPPFSQADPQELVRKQAQGNP
jgi:hypothetical protein